MTLRRLTVITLVALTTASLSGCTLDRWGRFHWYEMPIPAVEERIVTDDYGRQHRVWIAVEAEPAVEGGQGEDGGGDRTIKRQPNYRSWDRSVQD